MADLVLMQESLNSIISIQLNSKDVHNTFKKVLSLGSNFSSRQVILNLNRWKLFSIKVWYSVEDQEEKSKKFYRPAPLPPPPSSNKKKKVIKVVLVNVHISCHTNSINFRISNWLHHCGFLRITKDSVVPPVPNKLFKKKTDFTKPTINWNQYHHLNSHQTNFAKSAYYLNLQSTTFLSSILNWKGGPVKKAHEINRQWFYKSLNVLQ